MSDLLATSADTWRDRADDPPVLPPELASPRGGSAVGERVVGLRERHRIRRERAERIYAESRSPARGWPVAQDRAVVRFVLAMIRERSRSFTALVVLNALAAAAALAVPGCSGSSSTAWTGPVTTHTWAHSRW